MFTTNANKINGNNRTNKIVGYKKMQGGSWIRPERRLAIYIRDGFTCLYCGRDMKNANRLDVTLDHLTCRVQGGSNDSSNLVTACRSCNSSRSDKSYQDFAPGGAIERIEVQRYLPLNLDLAKALIENKTNADVEVR